jgi:hypothetical protein
MLKYQSIIFCVQMKTYVRVYDMLRTKYAIVWICVYSENILIKNNDEFVLTL